ncbi:MULTISPECIES: GntR family transcriptional regulator [Arcicella]|uniref:GntR family transcriptional regulator n=1 Tax=Arcicella aquatica TaxID=217141 RepID=A0ABU5QT51_9BACT|nr:MULTISPECIES: GntR family transcriptional regulator [Arcicella]MDR6563385.1 DNA-binding transcriptional regulator YhcF (GntR family) [Arcicella sp. BE51]MDR6813194.1 DNA-binding transcriptional regulator YhcF (GntR family) [Arcicella sp. BE140]MDR6824508.1 DNA-binding transcriptional regulator YhcF (GntR family) [Arcicella sp. BE139]MEA5260282.1 GntR family transcriptional regulator [Arcicella aquatica]
MYQLKLNPSDKTPKYKQIIQSVISDIERNVLKKNEQLPSISELSEEYYLARDTVEKAYRELKERGFITSVQGKGYYVNSGESRKMRILLIFNKLSSYKKIIYYAFLKVLGDKASVDLQIHHYNARLFDEIIDKNLGKYNYYVVMPHFFPDSEKAIAMKALEKIPSDELVLLDKDLPEYKHECLTVYQDFERDVAEALESANDLFAKYHRVVLVFPSDGNYPVDIVRGVRYFCVNAHKEFIIRENADETFLIPQTAYVVVEEHDLAELVKKVRQSSYTLGTEIGVVSFNETTLKELLGITVVTTDFETMGRTAAALLLDNKKIKIKNPFYMIRRETL